MMYRKKITYTSSSIIAVILYSFLLFFLLPTHSYAESYASITDRSTSLHVAALDGDVETVKALLKTEGVDVNAQCKYMYGFTPLHIAAWKGHLEVVKELLATKDIQVNLQIKDGYAPLHAAADGGNLEVVREFLKNKIFYVNIKNEVLWTPLHIAALKGHLEVVKELLNNKDIDVNAKDKDGYTPLHWAASFNHFAVVKALLETKSIQVNEENDLGRTPLHGAAFHGSVEVIKALLEDSRVISNIKNRYGQTPLDIAKKGKYDTRIHPAKKQKYDTCIHLLKIGFKKGSIKEKVQKIKQKCTGKKALKKNIEEMLQKMIDRNRPHNLFWASLLFKHTKVMKELNNIENYSLNQQKKYLFKLPFKQLQLICLKLEDTLKLIIELDSIQRRLIQKLLFPLLRFDEPQGNKKMTIQEVNNETVAEEVEKGELQFQKMIDAIQENEAAYKHRGLEDYMHFPYKKLYMVYTWPSDLAKNVQESFLNSSRIKQQSVLSDLKELRDKYESLEKVHKELMFVIPEHVKKEFEELSQKITKKMPSIYLKKQMDQVKALSSEELSQKIIKKMLSILSKETNGPGKSP